MPGSATLTALPFKKAALAGALAWRMASSSTMSFVPAFFHCFCPRRGRDSSQCSSGICRRQGAVVTGNGVLEQAVDVAGKPEYCVTDDDDKQSSGRLLDGVYPKRRRVAWNKA
jgi:hypothetical protein